LLPFPNEIKNSILSQEKKIIKFSSQERKTEEIAKKICKYAKKRTEDLLLYKSDSYRMKNELNNFIEENKEQNITAKLTSNNWISSLRRPKDFIGERRVIVNLGTDNRPNWTYKTDCSPKIYEHTRKQFNPVKFDKPETFMRNKSLIGTFNIANSKSQTSFFDLNSLNVSIKFK